MNVIFFLCFSVSTDLSVRFSHRLIHAIVWTRRDFRQTFPFRAALCRTLFTRFFEKICFEPEASRVQGGRSIALKARASPKPS